MMVVKIRVIKPHPVNSSNEANFSVSLDKKLAKAKIYLDVAVLKKYKTVVENKKSVVFVSTLQKLKKVIVWQKK